MPANERAADRSPERSGTAENNRRWGLIQESTWTPSPSKVIHLTVIAASRIFFLFLFFFFFRVSFRYPVRAERIRSFGAPGLHRNRWRTEKHTYRRVSTGDYTRVVTQLTEKRPNFENRLPAAESEIFFFLFPLRPFLLFSLLDTEIGTSRGRRTVRFSAVRQPRRSPFSRARATRNTVCFLTEWSCSSVKRNVGDFRVINGTRRSR